MSSSSSSKYNAAILDNKLNIETELTENYLLLSLDGIDMINTDHYRSDDDDVNSRIMLIKNSSKSELPKKCILITRILTILIIVSIFVGLLAGTIYNFIYYMNLNQPFTTNNTQFCGNHFCYSVDMYHFTDRLYQDRRGSISRLNDLLPTLQELNFESLLLRNFIPSWPANVNSLGEFTRYIQHSSKKNIATSIFLSREHEEIVMPINDTLPMINAFIVESNIERKRIKSTLKMKQCYLEVEFDSLKVNRRTRDGDEDCVGVVVSFIDKIELDTSLDYYVTFIYDTLVNDMTVPYVLSYNFEVLKKHVVNKWTLIATNRTNDVSEFIIGKDNLNISLADAISYEFTSKAIQQLMLMSLSKAPIIMSNLFDPRNRDDLELKVGIYKRLFKKIKQIREMHSYIVNNGQFHRLTIPGSKKNHISIMALYVPLEDIENSKDYIYYSNKSMKDLDENKDLAGERQLFEIKMSKKSTTSKVAQSSVLSSVLLSSNITPNILMLIINNGSEESLIDLNHFSSDQLFYNRTITRFKVLVSSDETLDDHLLFYNMSIALNSYESVLLAIEEKNEGEEE